MFFTHDNESDEMDNTVIKANKILLFILNVVNEKRLLQDPSTQTWASWTKTDRFVAIFFGTNSFFYYFTETEFIVDFIFADGYTATHNVIISNYYSTSVSLCKWNNKYLQFLNESYRFQSLQLRFLAVFCLIKIFFV